MKIRHHTSKLRTGQLWRLSLVTRIIAQHRQREPRNVRILRLVLLVSFLSACANSGPQPVGKETFMESVRVPFSGQSGAKTEALKTANAHCAQIGKKVLLNRINSSECALHGGCGEAEITYFCVEESDPRFKTPEMKKEADTVIRVETN